MGEIEQNLPGRLWKAIEAGDDTFVDKILRNCQSQKTITDAQHDREGYTSLILASKYGHTRIVELLLKYGAKQDALDYSGWTAKEHAAFQGHLGIAQTIDTVGEVDPRTGPGDPNGVRQYRKFRFDRNDAHVIVNIGVTQISSARPAVDLEGIEVTKDSELSLEISSSEKHEGSFEKHHCNLPLEADLVDNTMIIPVSDLSKARLSLKIFRNREGDKASLIGCGTVLLLDERNCYGTSRESLVREHIVPIISTTTFDYIGSVTLTFVLAKPYPHLNSPEWDILEELKPPRLVGHRGLGMNDNGQDRLQIGENTVQSFVAASNQGATFVEFDIQVTRDLVPILMHNYALSESGTDIPVHELTLEQFMHVSKQQSPNGHLPQIPPNADKSQNAPRPRRTRSESRTPDKGANGVQDRMKYTVEYAHKGFKANTRGKFIQETFATLAEALTNVPEEVAFNIEIKYPRRFEPLALSLAPVVLELNAFIDAVLDVIHESSANRKRKIILSSFTPDVCVLLSLKQKAFPIFLISNVRQPMDDKEARCANMRVAVKFAQCWGLQGVVFLGEIFLLCPRLVQWVKNKGLIVGSYGGQNNDPANVKAQLNAGVDLVYTDRVGLNAKVLKDEFGVGRQTKI